MAEGFINAETIYVSRSNLMKDETMESREF